MMKRIFWLICFIFHAHAIGVSHKTLPTYHFPLDKYLNNYKEFKVLYRFKTQQKHTQITVLTHKKSGKFIVKQDLDDTEKHGLKCALRDVLGALIARSIGVHANDVTFIPVGIPFPGKDDTEAPATLHTFVPGVSMLEASKTRPWRNVCIHQYMTSNVPPEKWGLTRSVIKNMSLHKDLCKITAFDTFIANSDRSLNNYFYEAKTDTFYVIDFECAFKSNLASYACNTIEQMLHDRHEKITSQERTGLKIYRDTLKQLIALYPPNIIEEFFLDIAQRGDAQSIKKQQEIVMLLNARYIPRMVENYESCKKLVTLIDRLLA